MGESQCAHCGHVVTGFEQVEFEQRAAESALLRQENETLKREIADLRARMERKDAALRAAIPFVKNTYVTEAEEERVLDQIRAALQEGQDERD